jgi:hypothetical protein
MERPKDAPITLGGGDPEIEAAFGQPVQEQTEAAFGDAGSYLASRQAAGDKLQVSMLVVILLRVAIFKLQVWVMFLYLLLLLQQTQMK